MGDILFLADALSMQCLVPADEFWARFYVFTEESAEGSDSDEWTLALVKPRPRAFPREGDMGTFLRGYCIGAAGSCIETGKRDTRLTGIYYLVQE
jgi:hypothetical protein